MCRCYPAARQAHPVIWYWWSREQISCRLINFWRWCHWSSWFVLWGGCLTKLLANRRLDSAWGRTCCDSFCFAIAFVIWIEWACSRGRGGLDLYSNLVSSAPCFSRSIDPGTCSKPWVSLGWLAAVVYHYFVLGACHLACPAPLATPWFSIHLRIVWWR